MGRFGTVLTLLFACLAATFATPSTASAETRALKVYFLHTGEKDIIAFKKNGKYIQSGLNKLNRFLRDWRRNEPTRMDPRLFDLIWEVYQASGSRDYIHVVSAYRSPQTNSMLRSRSKGVAKKSQHMLGKAMDFYLPDVKLSKLRAIGMKFQVGGVGYYPKSGSPFVHLDVGGVRAWPRMSRNELVKLFPNGRTLHLPPDGKPLPGYQQALADYKRRVGSKSIQVAGGGSRNSNSSSKSKGGNILTALFGGGGADEEEDTAESTSPRAAPKPPKAVAQIAKQRTVPAAEAPLPGVRPTISAPAEVVTSQAEPEEEKFPDLLAYAVPVPNLLTDRFPSRETPAKDDATAALIAAAEATVPEEKASPEEKTAEQEKSPAEEDSVTELAMVPVPGGRPEFAALAGGVVAPQERPEIESVMADAALASVPQEAGLSEEAIMAAAKMPVRAPEPGARPEEPKLTARRKPVMEVASLYDAVEPARKVRPVPEPVIEWKVSGAKGARPGTEAAKLASIEEKRQKKLSKTAISRWAISHDRVVAMDKPVKAPRYVSDGLTTSPSEVLPSAFSPVRGPEFDTERFSGRSVNFMKVARFGDRR